MGLVTVTYLILFSILYQNLPNEVSRYRAPIIDELIVPIDDVVVGTARDYTDLQGEHGVANISLSLELQVCSTCSTPTESDEAHDHQSPHSYHICITNHSHNPQHIRCNINTVDKSKL